MKAEEIQTCVYVLCVCVAGVCVRPHVCITEQIGMGRLTDDPKAGPAVNHCQHLKHLFKRNIPGHVPTCSHGRGMHRRRSYSEGGLGRSWRRFLPVQASLWGSTDVGDILGLRSGRSTRLVQTPGQDWTSPDWGIKERPSFKYRLGLFGGELYSWGWLEKGVKNSQSQRFLIAY